MTRLLPKSLLGQVTLAVALTLFLVQGVNAVFAWNIEKDRAETALVNMLGLRFVAAARIAEEGFPAVRIDPGPRRGANGERRQPRKADMIARKFGNTDFQRSLEFPVLSVDEDRPALAGRLGETLRNNGREFEDIRVVERPASADPVAQRFLRRLALRRGLQEDDLPRTIAVAGISSGGEWEIVRAPIRAPHRHFGPAFPIARAALMAALLCFVLWLVLRRITGPLAQLTKRTEEFSQLPVHASPMEPQGPEDVRRLIAAHNAMEARIGAMIDEKDVMLGAIGHDLKTPLAALRVRVEGVEDEAARSRMVDSIEDITRTLDEILLLARIGRADRPAERTELYALLVSVIEEFEDMDQPVALLDGQRIAAPVHLTWLKRGVRNLVANALRYGGTAEISLTRADGHAVIRIEDDGPGIPEDRIAEMLEPFTRGEASRNRATGGAGLGLTIARAVAEQHGGSLVLANRQQGGLRAELRLPLG